MRGADKFKFTHYASIYGIPCYWNEETQELVGRNALLDRLIVPASHLQNLFAWLTCAVNPSFENPGFPVKLKGAIHNEEAK